MSASRNNVKYKYSVVKYTPTGMQLQMSISTGKSKASSFGFSLEMDSIRGAISANNWKKELALLLPFNLCSANISIKRIDEDKKEVQWTLLKGGDTQCGKIKASLIQTDDEEWYGLGFNFIDNEEHSFELLLDLDITIHRKDYKPVLSFE